MWQPQSHGTILIFHVEFFFLHSQKTLLGWWVQAKTTIEDAENTNSKVTTCSTKASAVSVASISGIFVVSAAVATVFKKRRMAKIDILAHERAREATGHFEMMKDTGVQV